MSAPYLTIAAVLELLGVNALVGAELSKTEKHISGQLANIGRCKTWAGGLRLARFSGSESLHPVDCRKLIRWVSTAARPGRAHPSIGRLLHLIEAWRPNSSPG